MLLKIVKTIGSCIAIAISFTLLSMLGDLLGEPEKAQFLLYLIPVVWIVIIGSAIFNKPQLTKVDPEQSAEFAMALAKISDKRGDDLTDHIAVEFKDRGVVPPSEDALANLAAEIEHDIEKAANFTPAPAIAFVRTNDAASNSWLGGRPTLGTTSWPVDAQGTPLHHVAQIDLSDLPNGNLPTGLPRHGALAFFISTGSGRTIGAVAFVDDPTAAPSIPPLNIPDPFAGSLYHNQAPEAPFFARHTIAPHPLSDASAHSKNAVWADMERLFPAPSHDPKQVRPFHPQLAGPYRWHQMFGVGMEIQTTVEEHESDHLLFQFHPEHAMHPDWSDMGVYQFWISADALAIADWSRVHMTYACD